MKFPDDVLNILRRRFDANYRQWLQQGFGECSVSLGLPSEQKAQQDMQRFLAWLQAWQKWQGGGELRYSQKQWKHLSVQRLPEKLLFTQAEALAAAIGRAEAWQSMRKRYQSLVNQWRQLAGVAAKHIEKLSSYSDEDFLRLQHLLLWLIEHEAASLYPRQLPIAGMDSKWLESRKGLIVDCLSAIRGGLNEKDFYACTGLLAPPTRLRMRILDADLRRLCGGLSDISAPVAEIAALAIAPRRVFIVENVQTGLAFTDMRQTVVMMGLGYAVDVLAEIVWLKQAYVYYWGDIDTHGFAILHRARTYVPHLQSILMDEATMLAHQSLWGREDKPHSADGFEGLMPTEQSLYETLKNNRYAQHLRLEQERIDWHWAWQIIANAANIKEEE